MRLFLQGAVPAKPEVDSIWGMSRVYLGCTCGLPGVDLGYNRPGVHLEYTWGKPAVHLEFTSGRPGVYLG